MLIKMLEDCPVSTTGINKLDWVKGEKYEAPEELAANLIEAKLAAEVKNVTKPKERAAKAPKEKS